MFKMLFLSASLFALISQDMVYGSENMDVTFSIHHTQIAQGSKISKQVLEETNSIGLTHLANAILSNHLGVAQKIASMGAELNYKDPRKNPLYLLARNLVHSTDNLPQACDLAEFLIERGANPEVIFMSSSEFSEGPGEILTGPIFAAIESSVLDLIYIYLKNVNMETFNINGITPIEYAKKINRMNIVRFLSDEFYQMRASDADIASSAPSHNDVQVFSHLLMLAENRDLNAIKSTYTRENLNALVNGVPLISAAILRENFGAVITLLAAGADAWMPDAEGVEPLQYAIEAKSDKIITALLNTRQTDDPQLKKAFCKEIRSKIAGSISPLLLSDSSSDKKNSHLVLKGFLDYLAKQNELSSILLKSIAHQVIKADYPECIDVIRQRMIKSNITFNDSEQIDSALTNGAIKILEYYDSLGLVFSDKEQTQARILSAACNGKVDVVIWLLSKNKTLDLPQDIVDSLFDLVAMTSNIKILNALWDKNLHPSHGVLSTLIPPLIEGGNYNIVLSCLERYPEAKLFKVLEKSLINLGSVHSKAARFFLDQKIFREGVISMTEKGEDSPFIEKVIELYQGQFLPESLIFTCAQNGNINAVRMLQLYGKTTDKVDSEGKTALFKAIEINDFKSVKVLLNAGAQEIPLPDGTSPFRRALTLGYKEVVEAFPDHKKRLVTEGIPLLNSLFLGEDLSHEAQEMSKKLVAAGVPIDGLDGRGKSIFWNVYFLENTNKNCSHIKGYEISRRSKLRFLKELGANVDFQYSNETPLQFAMNTLDTKMALFLLTLGADPEKCKTLTEKQKTTLLGFKSSHDEFMKSNTIPEHQWRFIPVSENDEFPEHMRCSTHDVLMRVPVKIKVGSEEGVDVYEYSRLIEILIDHNFIPPTLLKGDKEKDPHARIELSDIILQTDLQKEIIQYVMSLKGPKDSNSEIQKTSKKKKKKK